MKRSDAVTAYTEYLLNPSTDREEESEGEAESNLHLMELKKGVGTEETRIKIA